MQPSSKVTKIWTLPDLIPHLLSRKANVFFSLSIIPVIFLGKTLQLLQVLEMMGKILVVEQVHTSLKFRTGHLSTLIFVTEAW